MVKVKKNPLLKVGGESFLSLLRTDEDWDNPKPGVLEQNKRIVGGK